MRAALLLLLLIASCAPSPRTDPSSDPKEREDEINTREVRLARTTLLLAIILPYWPCTANPVEINVRLAAAHARVVEFLDLGSERERGRHERHRKAGGWHAREAIRLDPESGEAHYWNGAILLHRADAERSYGLLKEALKEMIGAERLAPGTDFGGPDRMIARIYQETPGFPFLGSKTKAIEYYRKSLEIAPGFALTHLWLAETYLADKEPEKARAEARRVVEAKPRPGFEKDDAELRRQAEELLRKSGPE